MLQRHHHVERKMFAPGRPVEQGTVIDDIGNMGLAAVREGPAPPGWSNPGLVAVGREEGDTNTDLPSRKG